MKQIITLVLTIMIVFTTSAQKNVTKFLGIPVDGTKSAMIQQLKAKGYTYDAKNDYLTGEFNGSEVDIRIATNNNKVLTSSMRHPSQKSLFEGSKSGLIARCFSVRKSVLVK